MKISLVLILVLSCIQLWGRSNPISIDDVQSVRLLNHNNLPVKVFIYEDGARNQELMNGIYQTIKKINIERNLLDHPRNQLELVIIDSYNHKKLFPSYISDEDIKKKRVHIYDMKADQWLQDFGEIMVGQTAHDSEDHLILFDTNRGRGLEDFADILSNFYNSYFVKLDAEYWSSNSAGNYGGNIEATPNNILTLGNTSTNSLRNYFTQNGYEDNHLLMETDWLGVGHIDEYLSSVVFENDDPCGFALVKADPSLALELLIASDNSDFEESHHAFNSYDYSLRNYGNFLLGNLDHVEMSSREAEQFINNQHLISEKINRNIELLKRKILNVTPECSDIEVISFPTFFQCRYGTEGCASLLPGSVNMLVLFDHLVIPDPLFRPFQNYISEEVRSHGLVPRLYENLSYHNLHGEIHCGTNVFRLPNEYLNSNIRQIR